MTRSQYTVIGGGISGLATAWWLNKEGHSVALFEQETETGGTMKTFRSGGWLVETGPNSALETSPLIRTLVQDVGLADEMVYANPVGKNRFILRNGELHPLPLSPGAFFSSKLWSLPGKLRLLKEPFIGKADKEETIAEFVERRLGREFLDYAINPFIAGIFAGAPEQLSVRAAFPKLYALEEKYGGLIRGQFAGARERKKRGEVAKDRAQMFSFRSGMQQFPSAIAAALGGSVHTSASVVSVAPVRDGKGYDVEIRSSAGTMTHRTDSVILTIPAQGAANLIRPFDAALAEELTAIFYPPVTEVFLGYRTNEIGRELDGFGFLIPEMERRSILGGIWSSSLFAGRAPEGHAAFTVFVGGSRQPEIAHWDDERLVAAVRSDLEQVMRISGPPVMFRINRWERAIPQYRLGHLQTVERMEHFEQRYPGLFLSGNFRGGISVGDCIIQSERTFRHAAELQRTMTS